MGYGSIAGAWQCPDPVHLGAQDSHIGTQACDGSPMHTQAIEMHRAKSEQDPLAGSEVGRSVAVEKLLVLLAEQGALPISQIEIALGWDPKLTADVLGALEADGLTESKRFLATEGPWIWATRKALRRCGSRYRYVVPTVVSLPHTRAVNSIRFDLEARAPQGQWICERDMRRWKAHSSHIPDGIFLYEGEEHAIEAELTPKPRRQMQNILADHTRYFDAVIYFCGKRTYNLVKSFEDQSRCPKLVVRPLPGEQRC